MNTSIATSSASILEQIPSFQASAEELQEVLLANLVMIGEIPAPTSGEERRIRFMQDRFTECGLQHISTDERGNALGIIPGKNKLRNLLLVAHADTVFDETMDHTISVQPDSISGLGIGDNSLGLAFLMTLPTFLEALKIELDANLVLMGTVSSLGRGNLEGLDFFLRNTELPLEAGLCIEGVELGRLSHSSIGMARGEIQVRIPEEYDWTRFGAGSAIQMLNDVINLINEIPLPRKPRTSIVFGAIHGGKSFSTRCQRARLRFEIRSESGEMVEGTCDRITEIVEEVSSQTDSNITMEIVARRDPGGIPFSDPLVRHARAVLNALEVEPRISPSMSELAAFIAHRIPALTLGLTHGEEVDEVRERLEIKPMFSGIAQVLAVLLAMDGGICHEHG